MLKRGIGLFTTTGQIMEDNKKYAKCSCCSVCTSPYLSLCMAVCKYRSATFEEFIETISRRTNDEKGKTN